MITKVRLIPLYVLLMSTLGTSGIGKLLGGETPSWFLKQFTGTAIDLFPGSLPASFYMIAVLEVVTFLVLLRSLIAGEFLPSRRRPALAWGLLLAELTFVALAFGQRISHQYDQAFQLFAYAVLVFLADRALAMDRSKEEEGTPK